MSMDSVLEVMREELTRIEERLIQGVRDRSESVREMPWFNSKEISGPASAEARDSAAYYILGLNRKLMSAVGLHESISIASVLSDLGVTEMLNSLLLVAYLRGVAKALDLTGQVLLDTEPAGVKAEQPPLAATSSGQPKVCCHCGEVHSQADALPASLAEALRDFSELHDLVSIGQEPASTGPAGFAGAASSDK